jgi:hypothetical protein
VRSVPDVERALRSVEIEWPAAPALARRIRERVEQEGAPRRRRPPALVLGFAAAVLAVAVAFAVPPARSAILEFLGLKGVEVRRVETLPAAAVSGFDLGRRVTLAEAGELVDFPLPSAGDPLAVYVRTPPAGGMVTLVYGTRERPVLVSAFRGTAVPFLEKLVGPRTDIEPVLAAGGVGYWISGAPHVLLYQDASGEIREDRGRRAGDVLLWERGGVTYRIEGAPSVEAAQRLADAVAGVD